MLRQTPPPSGITIVVVFYASHSSRSVYGLIFITILNILLFSFLSLFFCCGCGGSCPVVGVVLEGGLTTYSLRFLVQYFFSHSSLSVFVIQVNRLTEEGLHKKIGKRRTRATKERKIRCL